MMFAVSIVETAGRLPRSAFGRHVAMQLLRSGTSAGTNYEEARAAESRADFVHKVKVAAKEMRETAFWLKLAHRAGIAQAPAGFELEPLIREANELTAMLMASARTASAKL